MILEDYKQQRDGLRWGVVLNGVLVMACRSFKRAKALVQRGNSDTPGGGVELWDLAEGKRLDPNADLAGGWYTATNKVPEVRVIKGANDPLS